MVPWYVHLSRSKMHRLAFCRTGMNFIFWTGHFLWRGDLDRRAGVLGGARGLNLILDWGSHRVKSNSWLMLTQTCSQIQLIICILIQQCIGAWWRTDNNKFSQVELQMGNQKCESDIISLRRVDNLQPVFWKRLWFWSHIINASEHLILPACLHGAPPRENKLMHTTVCLCRVWEAKLTHTSQISFHVIFPCT